LSAARALAGSQLPGSLLARRLRVGLALACVGALGGCAHTPAPCHARPPLPPRSIGAAGPTLPDAQLAELHDHGDGRWRGCLAAGEERVAFQLRTAPRDTPQPGASRPFVLLVPILAGGASLMEQVALRVHARGFDVAWCERLGGAMKEGQRAKDLDDLFRRTVLHQRLLLRWLRQDFAPGCEQFALGISLGGMVATVLAAQQPDLAGVAVCLSGGDLAGLIAHSSESRVQAWRTWRLETDAIGDDSLAWELREFLTHEPLRFAPAIATSRMLLVEATLDTVVPHRHHALLWEALGRPARYQVPLGHYTAALAIDAIIDRAVSHFDALRPAAAAADACSRPAP
jgi:pimeloyl-ACP methyl ester carboxylesterase